MFSEPQVAAKKDPIDAYIHNTIITKLKVKLGMEIPMNDPDFSFMGYLKGLMLSAGYRGLTLQEKISETLQRLIICTLS